MVTPDGRTAGARGLYFLGCFVAAPLPGWALGIITRAHPMALILSVVTLPTVLMMGYGIWHLQRIVRVVQLRIRGVPRVSDDPVAEHAAGAFLGAALVVAAAVVVAFTLMGRGWHGVSLAIAALVFGIFLGRSARAGRLPAPEFA